MEIYSNSQTPNTLIKEMRIFKHFQPLNGIHKNAYLGSLATYRLRFTCSFDPYKLLHGHIEHKSFIHKSNIMPII
jgi:hypothetical protein